MLNRRKLQLHENCFISIILFFISEIAELILLRVTDVFDSGWSCLVGLWDR